MAEQLKQGSKLLWYRIESMLGRGGFGMTYLATDTNLQTRVAIKEYLPADIAERKQDSYVLPRTGADGETYRWGLTRFIDEARILARFKHHNIVRVHSVFEENNTAYMVMDYEQGNGFDLLMRTPHYREEARLKNLFGDLLNGLELVHSHNVIHRDIKPSNIYIREDGSPVLLDFGSARQQVAGKSHSMTRVLTKGYAPYEQMDDDGTKQGPWTDIYALGATLYYVVGNHLPVDSFSRFTKLIQKQPDPLTPIHELEEAQQYSASFLNAIEQAMQFEARDRPQTVAEFRKLLLGEDTSAPAPPVETTRSGADDATVLAAPSASSSRQIAPVEDPTVYEITAPVDDIPKPVMPARGQQTAEPVAQSQSAKGPLALGAIALVLVAAGAFFLLRPATPPAEPIASPSPSEEAGLRAAAEANQQAQEQAAEEQARIAAEEAQARQEAERLAQEQAQLAEKQRALAEEQARAEAEARAEAQAQIEAEQAAVLAEKQRLAEEQARAEEAQRRLAEEQARAAEEARIAEEKAKALAEEKRLADEARAREEERIAAEKAEARAEQQRLAEEARAREAAARASAQRNAAKSATSLSAAERARQDQESDIQSVSRLFNDLKISLANCDTTRLQQVTQPTPDSRELITQLCSQYGSMDLGIANFQSNPALGVASATVQIRRLVSQSGDTVLPGSSWSALPLRTEKKNGYWQAVNW